MEFSALPPGGASMEIWPSLADRAFFLRTNPKTGEKLFVYDSPPSGKPSPFPHPEQLIILIHGLGDEADSWRHLIPLLNSRGYRVLALDLPGFGRSVAPGRISVKRHKEAVLSLIDAVTREKPAAESAEEAAPPESKPRVFLAGNSMGAAVAELAALERPDLVKGLVLLDGSIPGGPPMPGLAALAKLLFSRKWYRAYRNHPEEAWASLYPYYADLDAMPPEDRKFLRTRVVARVESSSQERAFFHSQRSLVRLYLGAKSGIAKRIRSFPGRIRLLWGESDRIVPLSSAKEFWLLRGDITLETIPGAGHLPQQEKPAESARLMADFFDQIKA